MVNDQDHRAEVIAAALRAVSDPQARGVCIGWLAARLDVENRLSWLESAPQFALASTMAKREAAVDEAEEKSRERLR